MSVLAKHVAQETRLLVYIHTPPKALLSTFVIEPKETTCFLTFKECSLIPEQRLDVERHIDGPPQRVRLGGEGQRERVRRYRHHLQPAVLRLARPPEDLGAHE